MNTLLLYLKDQNQLEASARVIEYDSVAKAVILDQSPFYPQGGGQAGDKGIIKLSSGAVCNVHSVKKNLQGQVLHYINEDFVDFKVDQEVHCIVEKSTRDLNSRAHSGGHLLDHAVEDLKLPLEVRGAYHFLPSPYVEYAFVDDSSIELSPEYLDALKTNLEASANLIVKAALPVTIYQGKVDDLPTWRQNLLPSAVKTGGVVRLVKFERDGFDPVPCSGTHVANSADILPIRIKKISLNRTARTIRVTYLLS